MPKSLTIRIINQKRITGKSVDRSTVMDVLKYVGESVQMQVCMYVDDMHASHNNPSHSNSNHHCLVNSQGPWQSWNVMRSHTERNCAIAR